MAAFSLFSLLLLLYTIAADYNLELTIGNTVINDLPELYHGYMTDWLTSEPCTNGSILEANFSNPDLIALTKALAPALWRIGGTPQDSAIYNFSEMCINGIPKYSCSKPSPPTINCLNITRWKEINTFAEQTNSKILFGLNACYGRETSSSSMNFTNIEQLFQYTSNQQNGFSNLYAFEFGNQQNERNIDANAYAKDFIYAHNLLHQYNWNTTPYFIGLIKFDGTQSAESWVQSVYTNLNTNLSSIMTSRSFTYHNYPCCRYPNGVTSIYSMNCLEHICYYSIARKKYGIATWMGEGSDCYGGGIVHANQTNRWIESFYYMYQLCESVKHGLKATVRADLVGGSYELIDRYTFIPNPDYWILWLWKNYVGNVMYNNSLNTTQDPNIRAYVFSSKQNNNEFYICSLINFNLNKNASITISIQGQHNMNGYLFDEYHVKGVGNDGLNTNVISVNDITMKYSNGQFPTLTPKTSSNPTIILQPHTMSFVIVYK